MSLLSRYQAFRRDLRTVVEGFAGRRPSPLVRRGRSRYEGLVVEPPPSLRLVEAPLELGLRELRVVEVTRETAEALSFTLVDEAGAPIAHEAGQFLSFELDCDPEGAGSGGEEGGGGPLRRAYSLSTAPDELERGARITVKRIEGGRGSGWLHEHAREGMILRARGPAGSFVLPARAPGAPPRRLVCVAGGSGITPIRAILRALLEGEEGSEARLIYGSRAEEEILFKDELLALAASHSGRFELRWALERPSEGLEHAEGLLDEAALERELAAHDLEGALYFVCGPAPMMEAARRVLLRRGVEEARIFEERFRSPQDRREARAGLPAEAVEVTLTVGSDEKRIRVEPGQTVLEAATAQGARLPFSCAMGGCAACKCKLKEGEVRMEEPNCLSDRERREGWILTCVSRPLTAGRIEVPR